jgi:hypothetical protein
MPMPSNINKITEGILVLPAIISNRYEKITSPVSMIKDVFDVNLRLF